jgi:phytoene dehydrogenase-like protein
MMLCLSTLAMMNDREAGYPLGGSLPIAKALEARYLSLGGTVHYRSKVRQVLVDDDRAYGLELEGGEFVSMATLSSLQRMDTARSLICWVGSIPTASWTRSTRGA